MTPAHSQSEAVSELVLAHTVLHLQGPLLLLCSTPLPPTALVPGSSLLGSPYLPQRRRYPSIPFLPLPLLQRRGTPVLCIRPTNISLMPPPPLTSIQTCDGA
jgi:hypothetical protein